MENFDLILTETVTLAEFISGHNKKNKFVKIKKNKNRKNISFRLSSAIITGVCNIYEDELAGDFITNFIYKLLDYKKKFSFIFGQQLNQMIKELYDVNSTYSLSFGLHAQAAIPGFQSVPGQIYEMMHDPLRFFERCPEFTQKYGFPEFIDYEMEHIVNSTFHERLHMAILMNMGLKILEPYSIHISHCELMDIKKYLLTFFFHYESICYGPINYSTNDYWNTYYYIGKILTELSEDIFQPSGVRRRSPLGRLNLSLRAQANVERTHALRRTDGCRPLRGCRSRNLQAQALLDYVTPGITLGISEDTKNTLNEIGQNFSRQKMSHEISDDTAEKLSSLLGVFKETNDNIRNASQSVSNGAFSLRDTIKKIMSTITGGVEFRVPQLDTLFDMLTKLGKAARNFIYVAICFMVTQTLVWTGFIGAGTKSFINIVVTIIGAACTFEPAFVKKAIDSFNYIFFDQVSEKLLRDNSELFAQADVGTMDTKVDCLLVLLQSISLGKSFYYEEDMISGFKKSISNWSRMKNDLVSSIDTWMSLVQSFITYIGNKLFDDPCIIWEGRFPLLKKYTEAAQEFLSERQKSPVLTYEVGRELERVQVIGREALSSLPVSATNERTVHRAVTDSLRLWNDKLMKANFLGNGPRIKPLGVLFSGPSQIGKSEFNSVFVRSVMARLLPKAKLESYAMNPTSEIYNRIVEQEFWDGWRDQSAVTIDELGARRDAVGQNSEAFESIRLINGSNYNLHAAHLDEKGVLNARPMLVSATSNEIGFTFDGLRFMKAFENRYTAFAVLPKPQYMEAGADCRYDYEKCKMKRLDRWFEEFEHLEFIEYDLTLARERGNLQSAIKENGKRFSATEMIDWAVEEIEALKRKGEMILRQHNKIIYKQAQKRPDWEEVKTCFKGADFEEFSQVFEKVKNVPRGKLHCQAGIANLPVVVFILALLNKFSSPKLNKRTTFDIYKGYQNYVAQGGHLNVNDYINLYFSSAEAKERIMKVTPLKGPSYDEFDCGSCIKCKAPIIGPEAFLEVSNSELWPENSHHMVSYIVQRLAANQEEDGKRTPLPVSCLRLKRDILDGDMLYKYGSPEHAHALLDYYHYVNRKTAETQITKLKSLFLSSFDGGAGRVALGIKALKMAVPVSAMLLGATVAISSLVKKFYPESRTTMSNKKRSRVAAKRRNRSPEEAQAFVDGKISSIMSSVVNKNQYRIYAHGQPTYMGFCTMIGGHVGFMPRHFAEVLQNFEDATGDTKIRLVRALQPNKDLFQEVPFKSIEFYDNSEGSGNEDILFFRLPHRLVARAKDIRSFFFPKKDLPTTNFRGALYKPSVSTSVPQLVTHEGTITPNYTTSYYASMFSSYDEVPYEATDAYRYDAPTVVGDCGSLLARIMSTGSNARILGMHVAGSQKGYAVSLSVNKEMLDDAYDYFYPGEKEKLDEELVLETELDATLAGQCNTVVGFTYLGATKGPRAPTVTKIVPSPLYEQVSECELAPVRLTPHRADDGTMVNPTEVARSIYSHSIIHIDDDILDSSVFDTIKYINRSSRKTHFVGAGIGPKKLSIEEAIWGIEGHEFLNGLKSSSSPGYPYCLNNPDPGTKKFWVGEDGKPDVLTKGNKELIQDTQRILNNASQGIRSSIVFTDFLKDECRKKGKAARPISGANQAYLAACNVEFGAVCEYLLENRIDNGFSIGVNPYSEEWSYLATFLKFNEQGKHWIDGDFKNFDASHTRQVMLSFLDLCNDFYGDRSLARDTLLEDLVNSVHISDGKVYMWDCSLPSGHPLTSIINCWNNLVINRVAFCKTYLRKHADAPREVLIEEALALYNDCVRTIVYGDDNVHRVEDDAKPYMNILDHSISMKEIGYTYTDANKRTDVTEFKPFEEISFLKRKFRFHDRVGRIVGPLDMSSLLNSLQWIKKNDVDLNDYKMKITTVLLELSFHDEGVFNKWYGKITRAAKSISYVPPYNSYSAYALTNAGRDEYL